MNRNGSVRKNKKLVIVGDGMSGKTCLLFAFKDDRFIPSHDATIFDTYVADIQVDGKTVNIKL
jgi:Ras family protein A